ncbi:hypothetical protein ABWK22_02440 [Gottfriedia acidiceleris]|uniref:hypothetical protein n=1 Tax=Gottfriedia acidiceleris TaxID=371036 RepID=UPI0033991B18
MTIQSPIDTLNKTFATAITYALEVTEKDYEYEELTTIATKFLEVVTKINEASKLDGPEAEKLRKEANEVMF